MSLIENTTPNPNAPIDPENINPTPEDGSSGYANDDAVRLTIQDYNSSKAWLEQYFFTTRWLLADVLYQSPPNFKNWEGTNIPRSFYRSFLVATNVNAIKTKALSGLFYETPAFKLLSREFADEDTIRAITAVQSAQQDMAKFRQEVKLGFHSAILFGTAIWKEDYYTETKEVWEYQRKAPPIEVTNADGTKTNIPTADSDSFVKTPRTKMCAFPRLKNVDIRYIFVNPAARTPNIKEAGWLIHEMPKTFRDLLKLADETYTDKDGVEKKRYSLPSEAEFRSWFKPPVDVTQAAGVETYQMNTNYVHHAAPRFQATTADPLDVPLRVLERWDCGKVITVILGDESGGYLIRNEANPDGQLPYSSVNWWDISDAFWGIGLGVTLSSDQLLQQGIKNGVIDIATLAINGPLLHARGANINTQQLRARLGGFVAADIPQGAHSIEAAVQPMPLPRFPTEAMAILEMSEGDTEATSGASEQLTVGAMGKGHSSMGRTATGAGGLMAAAESRLAGFVEDFVSNVYKPWLWRMHELNCQFMPMSALREMLNQELGAAFKVDEQKYLSSSYDGSIKEFEVLAGSQMAVKQQIAQWLPVAAQYLFNPELDAQLNQRGKYVDPEEVIHMMFDVGGSKNYYSVIKDLTPQMMQALQQSNPAAAKAAAQAQQQRQKSADKEKLQNQKAVSDLTSKLILEQAKKGGESQIERAEGELDRQAIEESARGEELTGEPDESGNAFGGNETA